MISLLLVLSLFVSTGVLWELRDTGITMVNDAHCGLKEHTHNDACYQDVLICGLEENEEHTHTAECYERRLICGYNEHIHDMSCYGIDDELIDEETDDELFALSGLYGDSGEETDEEFLVADLPSLTLNNEYNVLAQPKHNETATPGTISTIDNIAEGIKFTLFDYGNSALESQNNNYGYTWVWLDDEHTTGYWTHPNANTTDGINTGRNAQQDILFLAYGTPVDQNCNDPDAYNHNEPNGNGYRVTGYKPDMNSYSGDYNSNPVYSGNRPVTGIVNNTLTDQNGQFDINGYPTISTSGHSLDYLFNENELTDSNGEKYKTVYTGVNHLLQNVGGHLIYNSDENYAYYNQDTHNFTVYDNTYHIINDAHHFQGDVDNLVIENEQPVTYGSDNGYEMQIGFFPFDQYDWTRRDPNFNGNGFNHHFGMKMEAQFINPDSQNVSDPVIFSYSGDDDMWVFVDGKLVLDIGGIHEPTAGMIDFTNGLVWIQDDEQGYSASELSQYSSSTYPKPMNYYKTENNVQVVDTSHKWKVTSIETYLGSDWNNTTDNKHDIKMFYLERGGCYSNLAMDMNLPTLKPLTVQKTVDYQQHLVKDTAIDNKDYEFQVWEWDTANGVWVIPQSSHSNQPFYLPDNHFYLKDGQRKTFDNLGQNRQFKVVEIGVDPNIFDQVSVNGGTPTELNRGGANEDISSGEIPVPLSTTNSYTFNNRVIEDPPVSITVKKDWVDPQNRKPVNFNMKYKIMRTDSSTGEVKQVALKYEVTEDGVTRTKKRRTFILPLDKQLSGDTIIGLLSRYGDHIFTYKIEELNVPENFKASYSETTDGSGNKILQVTNTDISNVDIYVKKEWENPPTSVPNVKLVLKRERVGYSSSTETDLKVKIVDEGGNLIKEETITGLYSNGSAEIECDLPEGVVCYRGDTDFLPSVQSSPSQLFAKYEDDENILVVNNLAAKGNDPNVVANEVTIKVTSGNAKDPLLLLHHPFTRGPNGWEAHGDSAIVETSSINPYAKGDALLVRERANSWDGAKLDLDPALFKANKTYTFSAYVWSPVATSFKMTFNNGLGEYKPISEVSVNAETWTPITGTIKLLEDIDPYNMYLVVETVPYGNDYNNYPIEPGGTYFRMDEFIAVEGTNPVTVDPGTGVVTIGSPSGTTTYSDVDIYNCETMHNFSDEGWYKSGNPYLYEKPLTANNQTYYAVVVSNRSNSYDGVARDIDLQHGTQYHFRSQVAGHVGDNNTGSGSHTITATLKYTKTGGGEGYYNIASSTSTGSTWVRLDADFTIPADADASKTMMLYYEADGIGADSEFEVWSSRMYKTVATQSQSSGFTEPKDGYKINDQGQYESNYSNYNIYPDEYSITNPLHLDGDYTTENWFREVILTGAENVPDPANPESMIPYEYHWDKDALGEENGYLYRYWVEEVTIDGQTVATNIVMNGDDRTVESSHNDYIISYDKQFVATNKYDSPILVKNKYIWYKLPATGGRGTTGIYILGTVLTTIGILSGCTAYRRRRRRDLNGFLK